MVDLVDSELGIGIYGVSHGGIGDPGRYVNLAPRGGDVKRVGALAAAGLGAHGVAGGLEL